MNACWMCAAEAALQRSRLQRLLDRQQLSASISRKTYSISHAQKRNNADSQTFDFNPET